MKQAWWGGMVWLVVLAGMVSASEGSKKEKSPLPGPATWELHAFDRLFRVVRTEYDAEKKQICWTVRTREGYRTGDFVRAIDQTSPFTFTFLDAEDNELAEVRLSSTDFRGIPRQRVMPEGAELEIRLSVPRAMPRVKKVVLRQGRS